MRFYHGTAADALAPILRAGLAGPHLTSDYDLACYYAEAAAEGRDVEPVVLEVEIDEDDLLLMPDLVALTEPVGFAGSTSEQLLERVLAYPEPPRGMSWQDSLQLVASVVYEGLVPPDRLKIST